MRLPSEVELFRAQRREMGLPPDPAPEPGPVMPWWKLALVVLICGTWLASVIMLHVVSDTADAIKYKLGMPGQDCNMYGRRFNRCEQDVYPKPYRPFDD